MAIASCSMCGPPGSRTGRTYVAAHFPVGHPKSGVICGSHGCTNPAVIWLKKNEQGAYEAGERVFEIQTRTVKVKVQ